MTLKIKYLNDRFTDSLYLITVNITEVPGKIHKKVESIELLSLSLFLVSHVAQY